MHDTCFPSDDDVGFYASQALVYTVKGFDSSGNIAHGPEFH